MGEHEPWLQTDPPTPHGSWLKVRLWRFFGPRLTTKDPAGEDHDTGCIFWTKKQLLVALLIILALVFMGLLLLWNYQCIMVWHLCQDDGEYPGLPSFGKG